MFCCKCIKIKIEFSWRFYRFSESVAVENNRLKTDMADLKQQNQKRGKK